MKKDTYFSLQINGIWNMRYETFRYFQNSAEVLSILYFVLGEIEKILSNNKDSKWISCIDVGRFTIREIHQEHIAKTKLKPITMISQRPHDYVD